MREKNPWSIQRTELIKVLGQLSDAKAPSGFEDEVVEIAREFSAGWASVTTNSLLDTFIKPKTFSGKKPVVMLDAHADEVGGMVKTIRENGTLAFVELGRFSPGALAGQDVFVRTVDGAWIRGTIGVKPPHFMNAAERSGSRALEEILDIGATSKQDARDRFGVGIGEPVVPATRFSCDAGRGIAFGKAFDCRAGVCALLFSLRELARRSDLPFDVIGSISAQEEVGERGIAAAVRRVDPKVAFMFEGCPADDSFTPASEEPTALHQGPMFRYFDHSMITNPRYQRHVLSVAERCEIPVQAAVREGGGTNGGIAHLLDVPCAVAGIPCRYIHTATSICALDDIEAAARVAVEVVSSLTPKIVEAF
ncbi:M42 family metallopeptidase [Coriobacterium glomerans]|uniref:M42 family metallopeptidase n=1 Tax=Coriobacterium glomerans TaxID=33871 RepID=UPI00155A7ADC|nr:M42 family peptidase [Coriobacterium glomerans]